MTGTARLASYALLVVAVPVLVVAVIQWTIPVLVLMAGFSVLVLALARPFLFFGVAVTAIVASATAERMVPGLGFLDEAVILVSVLAFTVRRLIIHRGIVFPAWMWWFVGFVALGVVSAVINGVPTTVWVQGALLAVKAVLFALATAQLDWNAGRIKSFVKWGTVGAFTILGIAVVNFIIPRQWAQLILGYPSVDFSFGVPTLIGPFVHPASLGRTCAIILVAVFAYRIVVRTSAVSTALLWGSALGALLSFRVKSIVGALASISYLRLRNMNSGVAVVLTIAIPFALILGGEWLINFVYSDVQLYFLQDSARSRLGEGALAVAAIYAPLGAGFGRYGSFIAASNYSPEYISRGFDAVYGLSSDDGRGMFLTDTQWPAIVGEAGWIGAALFAAGLIHVALTFRRPVGDDPMLKWVRMVGVGWLILFVAESVAAPAFVSAPGYPFMLMMPAILAAVASTAKRQDQPRRAYASRSR